MRNINQVLAVMTGRASDYVKRLKNPTGHINERYVRSGFQRYAGFNSHFIKGGDNVKKGVLSFKTWLCQVAPGSLHSRVEPGSSYNGCLFALSVKLDRNFPSRVLTDKERIAEYVHENYSKAKWYSESMFNEFWDNYMTFLYEHQGEIKCPKKRNRSRDRLLPF